jgi:hypothetical protein
MKRKREKKEKRNQHKKKCLYNSSSEGSKHKYIERKKRSREMEKNTYLVVHLYER